MVRHHPTPYGGGWGGGAKPPCSERGGANWTEKAETMTAEKEHPPLDAWRLDDLLDKPLVGLETIGKFLNVSADTVRRWHRDKRNTIPIRRRGGRYVAKPSELREWDKI